MSGTTVLSAITRNFCGRCADQTDCGSGSAVYFCSGSGSAAGGGGGGPAAAVLLATAPLHWALGAAGFLGTLAGFNGRWLLRLRDDRRDAGPTGGDCVWDNGPDETSARVELRCQGPLYSVWRLTFRGSGQSVEYTRTACGWNELGVNVLAAPAEGHAGLAPAAVTVEPA
jgi:hypothetical protein